MSLLGFGFYFGSGRAWDFCLRPRRQPMSHWVKGVIFGLGAWLLMMAFVMPAAGAGLFGMSLGLVAPITTLVMHVIFGAVLGGVYGTERPRRAYRLPGMPRSQREFGRHSHGFYR